ncbi:MAG TPA: hypothetical protein VFM36_11160 [Thermoanaerobaculia bacterium]|nr:hypothetical protein [Thermoanaerobaculia bacterium]
MPVQVLLVLLLAPPLFAQSMPKTVSVRYQFTGLYYLHHDRENCPGAARTRGTIEIAGKAELGPDRRYRGTARQRMNIDACGVTEETREKEGDVCLATVSGDFLADLTVEFGGFDEAPTAEVEVVPQGQPPLTVSNECDDEFAPYLRTMVQEGVNLSLDAEHALQVAEMWSPGKGLRAGTHTFRREPDWSGPAETGGWTLTITVGETEPPKAVIDTPHRAQRAEPFTFNSSGSKGGITSRRWTLTPLCPSSGAKPFTAEGAAVQARLLCSTRATLTVSDGLKEDTSTAVIEIEPRPFKTRFDHDFGAEGFLEKPAAPTAHHNSATNNFEVTFVAAENVPAHPGLGPQEYLYPPDEGGGWSANGFEEDRIAEGPFAGVWYVTDYSLEVKRKTLMNRYLLPGVAAGSFGSFYDRNVNQGHDVDAYLDAIRAHEGFRYGQGTLGHSGLIAKSLRENDPARKLEAMVAADRDTLVTAANEELRATNRRLCEETADPLPVIWSGNLIFPYDDGSGWTPPTQATVGGTNYAYKQMGPCP